MLYTRLEARTKSICTNQIEENRTRTRVTNKINYINEIMLCVYTTLFR